ncbi:hypothetical protein CDN99_19960 [Roseateles aquatilis]|uniref:Uncharacterized protein n=1 Tax=Roseateles aquatilis TaxID=431061 RepID=A0A246J311_9BURK|nr:hypothetical protein [Roseateles aquatilis]OWQ86975.1 hypothetical protein CDN99_19960 [Roseateles aquatilis]
MRPRYNQFNDKRRLLSPREVDLRQQELERLAERARYGGNPEHERNPGDFGLTPPSGPRPGKSLCDAVRVFKRAEAEQLLRQGFKRGLVSDRRDGVWPKNVWSMTADGMPLEAQVENPELGTYHGYPMPESDPMHAEVVKRWGEPDV